MTCKSIAAYSEYLSIFYRILLCLDLKKESTFDTLRLRGIHLVFLQRNLTINVSFLLLVSGNRWEIEISCLSTELRTRVWSSISTRKVTYANSSRQTISVASGIISQSAGSKSREFSQDSCATGRRFYKR